MIDKSKIKIAVLSTYPPRECGLATFSKSLVNAYDELFIRDKAKIIAVSDEKRAYGYSDRVVFEIDQYNAKSYVKAAEFINGSSIEVVSLQHEYGIFGGEDGDYILMFLENLNKPVVTSFHSVLKEHNDHRHSVTQRIIDLSDSIVVMTRRAKKILLDNFKVDGCRIKIIEHGVPNVRFDQKEGAKKKLGLADKTVLLTFGLINRGKGVEHGIDAVSRLVSKYPNLRYLIIGATHPDILRREGESYRNALLRQIVQLGLADNVALINKYLEYDELVEYLLAADIYLAPQLDFSQSFSGTIAYAMGCGDAVISSPTNYSLEVLRAGRGAIVEPTGQLMAENIDRLVRSKKALAKMQLSAYQYARGAIWPQVGMKYLGVLESHLFTKTEKWSQRLPEFGQRPSLAYLKRMTDQFGLVQHAKYSKPDYGFGYSLDDQARAMIVGVKYLETFGPDKKILSLVKTYLKFLGRAVDDDGIIHNFIDKNQKYADKIASDDSISRTFWALSYTAASALLPLDLKEEALNLIVHYRKRIRNMLLKPLSYDLLGLSYLGEKSEICRLADVLVDRFGENSDGDWRWFEEELTWANAIVPYALVRAYKKAGKESYLKTALESLDFLERVCRRRGVPAPVGQDGWYIRHHRRALYDQQPIEAGDMVLLYNELYYTTGEEKYRHKAQEWMGWFFGNNIKEVIVYDSVSRGVFDGITRGGLNRNQGAESIVVFLLAYLSFTAEDQTLLEVSRAIVEDSARNMTRSAMKKV